MKINNIKVYKDIIILLSQFICIFLVSMKITNLQGWYCEEFPKNITLECQCWFLFCSSDLVYTGFYFFRHLVTRSTELLLML